MQIFQNVFYYKCKFYLIDNVINCDIKIFCRMNLLFLRKNFLNI